MKYHYKKMSKNMLLYCNVLRIYLTYWSITKCYVEKYIILATIREKNKFMYEHINVN